MNHFHHLALYYPLLQRSANSSVLSNPPEVDAHQEGGHQRNAYTVQDVEPVEGLFAHIANWSHGSR